MIWQQICRLGAFSCILCQENDARGLNLCEICADLLPAVERSCLRCAIPLFPSANSATERLVCGQCLTVSPPIRQAFSRFRYESPVTNLVYQLKFGGRLALARTLGSLLAEVIPERAKRDIDLLIPMPMTTRRRCSRGFNQAEEIARFTAEEVNRPVCLGALRRHGDQAFQAGLDRRQRQRNVKGVFSVPGRVVDRRVVLIDDVMTTGATVNAAAKTLIRAGALSVDVWVVARTG